MKSLVCCAVALFMIQCSTRGVAAQSEFPQVFVESVFAEVSQSDPRDLGIGIGGTLGLGDIGLGSVGVFGGVRSYFPEGDDSASGGQIGLDIVLKPTIIEVGGLEVRPVVGAGIDFERYTVRTVNSENTNTGSGAVVMGGVRAIPTNDDDFISKLGLDIAIGRSLFRDNDFTEVKASLIIFIKPRIVETSER